MAGAEKWRIEIGRYKINYKGIAPSALLGPRRASFAKKRTITSAFR
jgi:hypothetical protein